MQLERTVYGNCQYWSSCIFSRHLVYSSLQFDSHNRTPGSFPFIVHDPFEYDSRNNHDRIRILDVSELHLAAAKNGLGTGAKITFSG